MVVGIAGVVVAAVVVAVVCVYVQRCVRLSLHPGGDCNNTNNTCLHAQTLQMAMVTGPRMQGMNMSCAVSDPPSIELADPSLGLLRDGDHYVQVHKHMHIDSHACKHMHVDTHTYYHTHARSHTHTHTHRLTSDT